MVRTHKKQRKTAFLFRGPLRLQPLAFLPFFFNTLFLSLCIVQNHNVSRRVICKNLRANDSAKSKRAYRQFATQHEKLKPF